MTHIGVMAATPQPGDAPPDHTPRAAPDAPRATTARGVPGTSGAHADDLPDLDILLASSDVSTMTPDRTAALRVAITRQALAWHLERNPRYARYCEARGFTLDQLREPADLYRVPLLPGALFKRGAEVVASTPADPDVLHTTSSGTQGTVSLVPRDDLTLSRFFAGISIGTNEVLGQERSDLRILNLGPLDAGHLWIAYVMAGVTLFTNGDCYVEQDTFLLDRFVADLEALSDAPVMIVGPPMLILDSAAAVRERDIRLHPSSLVLTIGGWKRAVGSMLPRDEFSRVVMDAFRLEDLSRVRDTFNMVELNTVLFECAHHSLHCPPWLTVDAKDPRTLASLPSGESGILGFMDPTPTSYPGFILSDDFGSVLKDEHCACGRVGDVLRLERRINRVEGRGCALKLDQRTTR